jgi:hypothetical protein
LALSRGQHCGQGDLILEADVRHVIHCSGYNLAESKSFAHVVNRDGQAVHGKYFDWEFVCLGDPARGLLGRITMSLHLAEKLQPDLIIWSTGATYAGSISEAQMMMDSALRVAKTRNSSAPLKQLSVLEEQSKNTLTSLQAAESLIKSRYANEELMLHLVTSANHAPRVARDAAVAFKARPSVLISVVPAHTSYGSGTL